MKHSLPFPKFLAVLAMENIDGVIKLLNELELNDFFVISKGVDGVLGFLTENKSLILENSEITECCQENDI